MASLPPGWAAATDAQGRVYYCNTTTGESSWTLPSVVATSSSSLPSGWIETQDQQGRTYYVNTATNESSWTRPAAATAAGASTPSAVSTPSAAAGLPSGWIEAQDQQGRTYYVNTATNESSWTRPAVATITTASSTPASTPLASTTSSLATATTATAGAAGSSGSGATWQAVKDAQGRTYYVNLSTNESAWVLPDGARLADASSAAASSPSSPTAAAANPSALPDGWVEKRDDKGRVYYYNSALNTSSWTLPSGGSGGAGAGVGADYSQFSHTRSASSASMSNTATLSLPPTRVSAGSIFVSNPLDSKRITQTAFGSFDVSGVTLNLGERKTNAVEVPRSTFTKTIDAPLCMRSGFIKSMDPGFGQVKQRAMFTVMDAKKKKALASIPLVDAIVTPFDRVPGKFHFEISEKLEKDKRKEHVFEVASDRERSSFLDIFEDHGATIKRPLMQGYITKGPNNRYVILQSDQVLFFKKQADEVRRVGVLRNPRPTFLLV